MADSKITALTSISTSTDPANDPLVIVDVSDTSMAASGTTKKVTLNNLLSSSPTATGNFTITGNSTIGGSLGVTGALTSYTGQVPSAIRAAASDYASVAFDGTTTSTRITSTLTGQNIGTGDFSLWSRFRVPALTAFSTNPAVISLGPVATDGSGVNTLRIVLLSGGNLSIRSNDGSGATTSSDVSGFSAAYSGQVVDIVLTRTGSTVKLYINGTDTAITGTLNGSNSITSTYCHIGIGSIGSTVFTGRIYRSVVFNRALSASDVTELITTGVNPADQWGTQTGQTSGTLVASKRYRITTYVSADSFTNVGAASNATGVEFVATGTTPTTWSNASTLNRIGGLVDLDFTVGGGTVAYDRSTNGLDGTLFGGVSWTMPRDGQYINGPSTITGDLTVDTSTLKVDSGNDRVGIGTATPAAKLIVRDGLNRNLLVASDATQLGSSGIAIGGFTDGAAGYAPLSIISSSTQFGISGSTAMTLNATGLGVGVASPSSKFHVDAGSSSEYFRGAGNSGAARALVISASTTTNAGDTHTLNASSVSGVIAFSTNAIERMRLDASGNLILLSSNTPATLTTNGQLTVNATSNTNLRFSYRGSDGVTRTANLTLA